MLKSVKAIIGLAALAWCPPAFGDVVVNGSFESGTFPSSNCQISDQCGLGSGATDITGWTVTGSGTQPISWLRNGGGFTLAPADGNRWLDLTGFEDTVGSYGGVTQTLTGLTIGQPYLVSFAVGICNNGTSLACGVDMNLGGPVSVKATAGATSFTGTNNQATTGNIWQYFSFTFVTTATTADLSFQGAFNTSSNPFYIGLDNVSVNAVPEPSTFFLAGAGLAGLMAWARRRKSGK